MKIGLVLSGGGARGIAHLGVLKGLQEEGFVFDQIAGTSAGAIAGALFANGYTPDEILKIIETTPFYRHVRPAFTRLGLLRLDKAEELYRKYLPHDCFESLHIPMHVVATDLTEGVLTVFNTGELVRPILASCSLPGIFEPYLINKRQYVDGAVLNNMPVEVIEDKVDLIVGIHCNPFTTQKPITSVKGVLERSLILAVRSKTRERLAKCHLLIEPPELSRYDVFDWRRARDLFRIGYQYTQSIKPQLIRTLESAFISDTISPNSNNKTPG
ncbi:patatin-like phospholipase family protein [Larkinella sp. C7]|uniref:patatin-like phospholipase family protein n=1 Tax=Larkinella sp. C7 TaxID=2576607 RepID=UPI00111102A7|nr:patatin-like phospholipase family protein [Larkinella sp. C7]